MCRCCKVTVDDAFTMFRCVYCFIWVRFYFQSEQWSRIERERTLCQCAGGVQTEEHVLVDCNLAREIRSTYSHEIISFNTFDKLEIFLINHKLEILVMWDINAL